MEGEPISPLRQPYIQEHICSTLSFGDALRFFQSFKSKPINCPIPFYDRIDQKTWVFPGINLNTITAYNYIKKYGGKLSLAVAVNHDKPILVDIFLKMGINRNEILYKGQNAISMAIERDSVNSLKVMLDSGSSPNTKINEIPILSSAVYHQAKKIVNLLLEYKADPNIADNNGYTPLMHAAGKDLPELADKLLKAGANVNQKANNGSTALLQASARAHLTLPLLIAAGANINDVLPAQDGEAEQTPLIIAARNHQAKIISILLEQGVDINQQNSNGWSALMYAVRFSKNEAIKTLWNYGANIHELVPSDNPNEPPESLMMMAVIFSEPSIVQLLASFGLDINEMGPNQLTPLMSTIIYIKEDNFQNLIQLGADINLQNNQGETALMIAVRRNRKFFVLYLVCLEANINQMNNQGETALMIAVKNGSVESVNILLNAKVNINLRNNQGETALDLAKSSPERSESIIRMLERATNNWYNQGKMMISSVGKYFGY